jgi:D-Tyr-tRNAtyr deacylase
MYAAQGVLLLWLAVSRTRTCPVARGAFSARMQVEIVNDGPVTIVLET